VPYVTAQFRNCLGGTEQNHAHNSWFRRILLLDFIYRPIFFFKKQRFGSWLCFRLQVKRGGRGVTPTLWGPVIETSSF
jgi:hypothetical protein